MKKIHNYLMAIGLLLATACEKRELPENPTIVSPINALVLNVNGIDYTATPFLKDGALADTLKLNVQRPSATAVVKRISLTNNSKADIESGASLLFTNNVAAINITNAQGAVKKHFLKMIFTPPPIMYVPLSNESYTVRPATTQTIASGNYDTKFEGYIEFKASWAGFYLVTNATPAVRYGINAGFDSGTTHTLQVTTSAAPWGDWGTNGYWKFNYNADTRELTLLKTDWALSGSATGNEVKNMTYAPATKTWFLTATLAAGTFKFNSLNTPAIVYGDTVSGTNSGTLTSGGNPINIATAGTYTITLSLSKPPYYAYTIVKQ
ncbi:hypothetical protein [Pedobacter xixiisoli]|uniref:SusE outer membrane protein n=1 Tax=Pedobacter xixiisoli TaxID=1476464 RepID=A0A285ZPK1_9SPHI|nr:hypothetical protein [Pedobacter xixiisoli]SOD11574.1 hypothetical protein SAMN06297358_0218 [Pedobacter xixiisoli]